MFVVHGLQFRGVGHGPAEITAEVTFNVGGQLVTTDLDVDPDPELDRLIDPLVDFIRSRLRDSMVASRAADDD